MGKFKQIIPAVKEWVVRPAGRSDGERAGLSPISIDHFVVIVSQGRTGSTLILRMLNAVPGVRICGENYRAFDHLTGFVNCFKSAADNHSSDFYKLAWLLPCDEQALLAKTREFVLDLYNPGGAYKVVGFKEIRYCRFENRSNLAEDMALLRELFPNLRLVFNVRKTEDCVKSSWWADDPEASAASLERVRAVYQNYYDHNRDHCYWMPYEELHHSSQVLKGMFDFLGLPLTPPALQELNVRLRL